MDIIRDVSAMKAFARNAAAEAKSIGLVPTMGFLHEGHISLVRTARKVSEVVVVSIFVNPTQFGEREDLDSYPRDEKRDLDILEKEGVDVVFCPVPDEVYSKGHVTFVEVGGISDKLCGGSRPGHFRGVATVVLKLFNIIRPDKAFFGLKDYQQQLVIRRMVTDLDLDVEILSLPTVREDSGLALSSRNSYLDENERLAAEVIPSAFTEARRLFAEGERSSGKIIEKMKKIMDSEPLVVLDYLRLCNKETLVDLDEVEEGRSILAIALRIGETRLIDNTEL